ncbi:hypothetical protein [Bacillus thuringiensis]|uniref:hypothetical protein n=1 Tax=Bacillus thuringiensis TaxID=1428 RepID=UPI000401503C|nr:hypothetical protein [Bacillus thuringiensis]
MPLNQDLSSIINLVSKLVFRENLNKKQVEVVKGGFKTNRWIDVLGFIATLFI